MEKFIEKLDLLNDKLDLVLSRLEDSEILTSATSVTNCLALNNKILKAKEAIMTNMTQIVQKHLGKDFNLGFYNPHAIRIEISRFAPGAQPQPPASIIITKAGVEKSENHLKAKAERIFEEFKHLI